jgi:hypothetical protein
LWLRGCVTLIVTHSSGGFAYVGVACVIYGRAHAWIPAAIVGVVIGAVRNLP